MLNVYTKNVDHLLKKCFDIYEMQSENKDKHKKKQKLEKEKTNKKWRRKKEKNENKTMQKTNIITKKQNAK